MKDLKHETAKMIVQACGNLAQGIAGWSFEFWQRKDFRLYVQFEKLTQTEQDRIFNELEVSLLGLFVLRFENAVACATLEEQKIVFSGFVKDLPVAFLQLFIDLGIEKKFIDQWKMLINMRLTEYRKDYKTALSQSQKWNEFDKSEETLRIAWARIETITIDCLTHIKRGKVEKDDPLWKLLRKWLITMDSRLNPITGEDFSLKQ